MWHFVCFTVNNDFIRKMHDKFSRCHRRQTGFWALLDWGLVHPCPWVFEALIPPFSSLWVPGRPTPIPEVLWDLPGVWVPQASRINSSHMWLVHLTSSGWADCGDWNLLLQATVDVATLRPRTTEASKESANWKCVSTFSSWKSLLNPFIMWESMTQEQWRMEPFLC